MTQPEKKRRGGCLLLFALSFAAFALLAGVGVWYAEKKLNSPQAARMAEDFVKGKTGMELKIGGYRYTPPNRFVLERMVLKPTPDTRFYFHKMELSVEPAPLLAGTLRVAAAVSSGGGRIYVRAEKGLKEPGPILAQLWVNDYPLKEILNQPGKKPFPLIARVGGTGLLTIPPEGMEGAQGNLVFKLTDTAFREEAFKDHKAFKDNDDLRRKLLDKLAITRAECAVAVADGLLSDKGCGADTSFGRIEARFRERMAALLKSGELHVGLNIFEPKKEAALYLMFTRRPGEDGSYHLPVTLYFKEQPEPEGAEVKN